MSSYFNVKNFCPHPFYLIIANPRGHFFYWNSLYHVIFIYLFYRSINLSIYCTRIDMICFRYCESRCKVLLDHVHEGYDKDLWEYHALWSQILELCWLHQRTLSSTFCYYRGFPMSLRNWMYAIHYFEASLGHFVLSLFHLYISTF